jgi:hypothetical protein
MTTPVSEMTVVPTFPSPGDPLYNTKAWAWAGHMAGTYRTEVSALAAATYANANEAVGAAAAALTYSGTALAARDAALASAGALPFSNLTNYAQLQAAISFNNGRTYRRKTAGISATDPQADAANWFEANAISGMASGAIDLLKGADIASAATPNIWAVASGNYFAMTGTANVTGFTAAPQNGAERWFRAAGAFTLVNGANLIVQGGANYTCAVGDMVQVRAHTTTQFIVTIYRADGAPTVRDGMVLLGTATAAGVASITFTTAINSAFDEYVLSFFGLRSSSSAVLRLRTSADGGATWASTAGDYYGLLQYNSTSVAAPAGYSGTSETYIYIGAATIDPNAANGGLSGEIRMYLPADTTAKKQFRVHTLHLSGATEVNQTTGACYRNSTAAINALQITASTGNLTGLVRLYGIKKS